MFLKIADRFRHSLALRLTVWYAGIFVFFSCVAFVLAYFSIVAILQTQMDEDLEDNIAEFTVLMRSGGIGRVNKEIGNPRQRSTAGFLSSMDKSR